MTRPHLFMTKPHLVNNRIYQIMAIAAKDKENTSEIDAFLKSFKLLGG